MYKIKFTDGMREHLLSKADMSGYKSPIEIAVGEMRMSHEKHIESEVFKAIREVGISVDREELLKALRYDRQQYEKGYVAGYARRESEMVGEIFARIIEELESALKNNYEVRQARYEKSGYDDFTEMCTAKIYTLYGILDFIHGLMDKYKEVNNDRT